MSEQLTDNDDDVIGEDQIIIEDAAEGDVLVESDDATPTPAPAAAEEDDEDDDPERDADDERLGEDEDGKPKPSRSAIRRKFFREQRKREKAELAELRALAPVLMQRLAAVEGSTIETNVASVSSQIEQAQADLVAVQQAITKAVEDGDGATFAQATDLKDKITAKIAELRPVVTQLQEAKQKLTQQPLAAVAPTPTANPAAEFERQWMAANPWFDAKLTDERSQMADMVHKQMVQEGYSPTTPAHWPELSRRLKALIQPEDKPARKPAGTPVPTGMGREHAAPGGRTPIRLSAERVQAMKDAGYWDDPVLRTSMIKQYQEYDRNAGKGS